MIVVDASFVVPAVSGLSRQNAEALLRIAEQPAFAPQLLDLEVISSLRSMVRRGELAEPLAQAAVGHLAALPVTRIGHQPLVARCWELRHNLTAYDASYVALAEALGAKLVTADARLARAPGIGCEVELVT